MPELSGLVQRESGIGDGGGYRSPKRSGSQWNGSLTAHSHAEEELA
jgi:hypothetical protein